MYARRSKQVCGFVDFPIDDPAYKNSGEGGMFVRLVVDDPDNDPWVVCCGGYCSFDYDENYTGDDRESTESYHFPSLNDPESSWEDRNHYRSVAYLCVVNLGSTGWSGWNEEKGEYFLCRYENLTAEGKELYNMIKKLYEGKGTLYLQTWLDT